MLNSQYRRRQEIGGRAMRVGAVLTVLVVSLCAPGILWAHDWYSDLKQPSSGAYCCGPNDCHPLDKDKVRSVGDQLLIYVGGMWRKVDLGIILQRRSPDGRLHVCTQYY